MTRRIFRDEDGNYVDPEWVESTEEQTEFERGVAEGIRRREALAKQVLDEAIHAEKVVAQFYKTYIFFWITLIFFAITDLYHHYNH